VKKDKIGLTHTTPNLMRASWLNLSVFVVVAAIGFIIFVFVCSLSQSLSLRESTGREAGEKVCATMGYEKT